MLCCTACEDGQSIASGSSNGSVHVWRVEYVTRSGGLPEKYTGFQGELLKYWTASCARVRIEHSWGDTRCILSACVHCNCSCRVPVNS